MKFDKNKNYTFLNPASLYELHKSNFLKYVIDEFTIGLDGIFLCWVKSILSFRKYPRLSFDDSSLAPEVFTYIENTESKLGIIGSKDYVISSAKYFLEKKYRSLDVFRVQHGYFSSEEEDEILKEFRNVDVLICSMGSPMQEIFILKLRRIGWEGTAFTCGGYFDQLVDAKGKEYYPYYIDKLNLRWLFRLYKEPRRLWKRYFFIYPIGTALFLIYKSKFKYINKD